MQLVCNSWSNKKFFKDYPTSKHKKNDSPFIIILSTRNNDYWLLSQPWKTVSLEWQIGAQKIRTRYICKCVQVTCHLGEFLCINVVNNEQEKVHSYAVLTMRNGGGGGRLSYSSRRVPLHWCGGHWTGESSLLCSSHTKKQVEPVLLMVMCWMLQYPVTGRAGLPSHSQSTALGTVTLSIFLLAHWQWLQSKLYQSWKLIFCLFFWWWYSLCVIMLMKKVHNTKNSKSTDI